jgi:hypothetical protein
VRAGLLWMLKLYWSGKLGERTAGRFGLYIEPAARSLLRPSNSCRRSLIRSQSHFPGAIDERGQGNGERKSRSLWATSRVFSGFSRHNIDYSRPQDHGCAGGYVGFDVVVRSVDRD